MRLDERSPSPERAMRSRKRYDTDDDESDEYQPDDSDTESSDEFEYEPLIVRLNAPSKEPVSVKKEESPHPPLRASSSKPRSSRRASNPGRTSRAKTPVRQAKRPPKRRYSRTRPDLPHPTRKHARHDANATDDQLPVFKQEEHEEDRLYEARIRSVQLLADLHKVKQWLERVNANLLKKAPSYIQDTLDQGEMDEPRGRAKRRRQV